MLNLIIRLRNKLLGISYIIEHQQKANKKQARASNDLKSNIVDALALTQLNAGLNIGRYIPLNNFSIRPQTLVHICNDIIINDRKCIVEFGSGASTLYIDQLLSKNNIDAEFWSVDHDASWQKALKSSFPGSFSKTRFISAPLQETPFGKQGNQKWYENSVIAEHFGENKSTPDLIIVDGPQGNLNPFARFPVVHFISSMSKKHCVVFVDDTNRTDESEIVQELKQSQGFTAEEFPRYAYLYRGKCYNSAPIQG